MDQAVSCRDVIAQEYLMEVITQVFPDDFHLRTLEPFLSATAQLHPKVNVKQIIISLIDRLAAFAAREAEGEEPNEAKRQREERIRRIADARKRKLQGLPVEEEAKEKEATAEEKPEKEEPEEEKSEEKPEENTEANEDDSKEDSVDAKENIENAEETLNILESSENSEEKVEEKSEEKAEEKVEEEISKEEADEKREAEEAEIRKVRGIPEDVELFVVFWAQIVELVKARRDMTVQDMTALLVSLINLSLSCYPEKLEYVDQILAFAKDKVLEFANLPDLHSKSTEANLLSLLLAPIQHYNSVITLLALANYQPLLALQPFSTRQSVSYSIITSILKNATIIDIPEDVHGILDLCDVLLRDQKDAPVSAATLQPTYGTRQKQSELSFEQEEYIEKQGLMARMTHMFKSDNEDTQFLVNKTKQNKKLKVILIILCVNSCYLLLENNLEMGETEFVIPFHLLLYQP